MGADPEFCRFCAIVSDGADAHVVVDDPGAVGFLDVRPLFPGHVLVVPRAHHVTLADVPAPLLAPLFETVQRVAAALPAAMGADGSFVAMNNVVSQSVAHLHVHVVPRRRGDGLRGFFWPRGRYATLAEMADVAARITAAMPTMSPHARPRGDPS